MSKSGLRSLPVYCLASVRSGSLLKGFSRLGISPFVARSADNDAQVCNARDHDAKTEKLGSTIEPGLRHYVTYFLLFFVREFHFALGYLQQFKNVKNRFTGAELCVERARAWVHEGGEKEQCVSFPKFKCAPSHRGTVDTVGV